MYKEQQKTDINVILVSKITKGTRKSKKTRVEQVEKELEEKTAKQKDQMLILKKELKAGTITDYGAGDITGERE